MSDNFDKSEPEGLDEDYDQFKKNGPGPVWTPKRSMKKEIIKTLYEFRASILSVLLIIFVLLYILK
jgi:hypothetical protein